MTNRSWKNIIIGCFLLMFVSQTNAYVRKKIVIPTRISKVSVFSNTALVEREAAGNFQTGRHILIFKSLTALLKDNSVRISGKGTAKAEIFNVMVRKAINTHIPKESEKKLILQKTKVKDEILNLKDRIFALKEKQDLLKKLGSVRARDNSIDTPSRVIDLNQWQRTLDFLENQLINIFAKRKNFQKLLEKKEKNLLEIEAKLAIEQGTEKKKYKTLKEILVNIEITKPGSLKFDLSYVAPRVKWVPEYDLKLDTKTMTADLEYKAFINQATQEDWENVQLTLSTAKPLRMLKIPEIKPIYVNTLNNGQGCVTGRVTIEDGTPIPGVELVLTGSRGGVKSIISDENGGFLFSNIKTGTYSLKAVLEGFKTVTYQGIIILPEKVNTLNIGMQIAQIEEHIMLTASGNKEDEEIKGLQSQDYEIKDYGISTEFKLLRENTVLSNAKDQMVSIRREALPFKKRYLSIPKYGEVCFLQAKLTNNSNLPLLAGKVKVFMDHLMLNTMRIPLVHTGKEFDIDLGVDEGITVKRKDLDIQSKVKGFLKRKSKRYSGYTIEVINHKPEDVEVHVLDQIPFSKNKDIQIKLKKLSPRPIENKDGIMHWVIKLKPKEKKILTVDYELSHPKKLKIIEYR